jgi:PAS domain S-box-containing protein
MASGFFDRLVTKIDKLNPESLQTHLLRLADERGFLETIFQSIQEGIMVIDSSGVLQYSNQAAGKLLGFSPAQSRSRSMLRYLREWDWEHILEIANSDEWASVTTREIEIMYPDHRFVSIYATPVGDGGRSILLMLRDVTDAHERESSAIESERTDAVKQLAAGVAHEIGNPLNALNIHLQLLDRELRSERKLDAESRDYYRQLVETARSEVGRLDSIIRQFLGALRPSRPNLKPETPVVVLRDALQLLKSELENRGIEVSVEAPSFVPHVLLDSQQIKQVFYNLVKNAMDAMSDNGKLRIVFDVTDAFVNVSVWDNGKGIASGELGRIFEPFHTTKSSGTGLGLMIVKRIVEDHGGEIEVASKEGAGSCFKIRLPLAERRIRRLTR